MEKREGKNTAKEGEEEGVGVSVSERWRKGRERTLQRKGRRKE